MLKGLRDESVLTDAIESLEQIGNHHSVPSL